MVLVKGGVHPFGITVGAVMIQGDADMLDQLTQARLVVRGNTFLRVPAGAAHTATLSHARETGHRRTWHRRHSNCCTAPPAEQAIDPRQSGKGCASLEPQMHATSNNHRPSSRQFRMFVGGAWAIQNGSVALETSGRWAGVHQEGGSWLVVDAGDEYQQTPVAVGGVAGT